MSECTFTEQKMDLMENKCNDNGLSQHLTNVHLKDDHENESEPIQRHPEPDECSTSSSDMIDRMLQTPQMQNEAIEYRKYESEWQMGEIKSLMQIGLSEPYSIYTYRYFIYNWPELCYLAYHEQKIIGAIICKFETVLGKKCGYIAMLAVNCEYRRKKIGCNLVLRSIREMQRLNAQEVRELSHSIDSCNSN